MATNMTLLQTLSPDHLRGRVMGLYMLLFAGSTPIGAYLTGQLAQHLGVSTALGIEAGLCVLGVAVGIAYYLSHRAAVRATEGAGR